MIERIRLYVDHLCVRVIAPVCYVTLHNMFQLELSAQFYLLSRALDSLSRFMQILDRSSILIHVLNCLTALNLIRQLLAYPSGSHTLSSSH